MKLSAKTNPKNAKITWKLAEENANIKVLQTGEVNVKKKAEPGVYVILASIEGSLESECELIVK